MSCALRALTRRPGISGVKPDIRDELRSTEWNWKDETQEAHWYDLKSSCPSILANGFSGLCSCRAKAETVLQTRSAPNYILMHFGRDHAWVACAHRVLVACPPTSQSFVYVPA